MVSLPLWCTVCSGQDPQQAVEVARARHMLTVTPHDAGVPQARLPRAAPTRSQPHHLYACARAPVCCAMRILVALGEGSVVRAYGPRIDPERERVPQHSCVYHFGKW